MRSEKLKNIIKFFIGTSVIGLVFVLTMTTFLKSQVQEIAGLAVADVNFRWNNLKDAAQGDNLTSGLAASGMYIFDGTNWDRVRGTGGTINVSGNVVGAITPADNFANPTNAITSWSLLGIFDGSTWDRALASTHGDNLTTAAGQNTAAFGYWFDGTNWDRMLSSVHGDDLTTASGLNIASFGYVHDGTNWDRIKGTSGYQMLPQTALLTLLNGVTGTGAGSSNDMVQFMSKMTWQVVITGGTLSALVVNLEGSIDNTNWFVLDTNSAVSDYMRHIGNKPIQYVRGNVTTYTVASGTPAITVKFIGGGN